MWNIQGGELVLLIVLALVILGPERLPGYAAKLGEAVRRLRDLAEGARSQIKDEMGPAFEDVDWRQLDPRQYDPRRIVREALTDPTGAPGAAGGAAAEGGAGADGDLAGRGADPAGGRTWGGPGLVPLFDASRPTPFDVDAT